jgi:hypothetical protein
MQELAEILGLVAQHFWQVQLAPKVEAQVQELILVLRQAEVLQTELETLNILAAAVDFLLLVRRIVFILAVPAAVVVVNMVMVHLAEIPHLLVEVAAAVVVEEELLEQPLVVIAPPLVMEDWVEMLVAKFWELAALGLHYLIFRAEMVRL